MCVYIKSSVSFNYSRQRELFLICPGIYHLKIKHILNLSISLTFFSIVEKNVDINKAYLFLILPIINNYNSVK